MIKQTYKKWIAACTVTSSLLLGACTSTPPSVRDVSIVPLPNNVQQDSSAFVLPKSCRSRLAMSRRAAREARMTSRDSLPTTDRNEGVNRDREMRTDYPSV